MTVVACGCGRDFPLALATHWPAVLAHPTGNLLNGLHEARNGADAAHTHDIATFTGGSRLFQSRATSEALMAEQAHALLVLLVPPSCCSRCGWTPAGFFCWTSPT